MHPVLNLVINLHRLLLCRNQRVVNNDGPSVDPCNGQRASSEPMIPSRPIQTLE